MDVKLVSIFLFSRSLRLCQRIPLVQAGYNAYCAVSLDAYAVPHVTCVLTPTQTQHTHAQIVEILLANITEGKKGDFRIDGVIGAVIQLPSCDSI